MNIEKYTNILHSGAVNLTHVVALNPSTNLLTFQCQVCHLKLLCSIPSTEFIPEQTNETHFELRIVHGKIEKINPHQERVHKHPHGHANRYLYTDVEKSSAWITVHGSLIERKVSCGMYRFSAGNNTIIIIENQRVLQNIETAKENAIIPACTSSVQNTDRNICCYPWLPTLPVSNIQFLFEIYMTMDGQDKNKL